MKTRRGNIYLLTAIAGIIGGGVATKILIEKNENKPANILRRIQTDLSSIGTIGDSWIDATPAAFEDKQIYIGVIRITENNKKYRLQFKVDINNGEVLEMKRLKA